MAVDEVGRLELDAGELVRAHPPEFSLESKRRLYDSVTLPITGTVGVSQWRGELPSSAELGAPPDIEVIEAHFAYPPDDPGTTRWHLNFADSRLFVAYGSSLMAQDELQVMEHPVLGSLREFLVERAGAEVAPYTRDGQQPTPILVRGAQRSLAIDTAGGLYGNAFARTPFERILEATTILDPPTFTNIVAVAAPSGGYRRYSRTEIVDILTTAYIGFSACRLESGSTTAVIHTGNWGTGAFGGNKVLMALLQLCAARLAGIERIVFHSAGGMDDFNEARRLADGLLYDSLADIDALIDEVHSVGFEWGVSDGN